MALLIQAGPSSWSIRENIVRFPAATQPGQNTFFAPVSILVRGLGESFLIGKCCFWANIVTAIAGEAGFEDYLCTRQQRLARVGQVVRQASSSVSKAVTRAIHPEPDFFLWFSTLEFCLVENVAALVHPLPFCYLRGGRLIVLQFRGPCSNTGFRVDKEESLYLGYFDEFGHNGLYISRSHATYKTHPVFGIGGFIIPAEHARELSARFRFIKEQGLKEEIDALVRSRGMPVEQWEKKGSALLTTKNIETYPQTRRIVFRVLKTLDKLGAKVVYYGQQKPCGGPGTVLETTCQRYGHAMKQLITRVQRDLPGHETFLIVLDKQGKRERLDIFTETAAFMFSDNNADRLIEPPMEVESHLYQTVQCADWICAILGRISAYLLDPAFAEFAWAPKYFGTRLAALSTPSSKIRTLPGSKDIHPQDLARVTI